MPEQTSHTAAQSRSSRPTAIAAAVLTLLLALTACSDDGADDGAQPQLGGEVTEPEQGIAEAGEAQLAPGAGVADEAAEGPEAGSQAVGDPAFVSGDFGQVPIPTGAEPFNDATVEDDVTVQSFQVTATSVTEVIDFYRGELEMLGWAPGQENASGENADSGQPEQIQATWTKDGQTLLVTAADIDGDDAQLTLQLSGA